MRIASIAFLITLTLLLAETQVDAAVMGVGFASSATEESVPLANAYEDLVTLTITVSKEGYVVLTGSGVLTLYENWTDPVGGWAGISIGTLSGQSNNDNEIGLKIPPAPKGSDTMHPFSITTVIPVRKGVNHFYMVGIRDPNTDFATWVAWQLKLTALFADNRID